MVTSKPGKSATSVCSLLIGLLLLPCFSCQLQVEPRSHSSELRKDRSWQVLESTFEFFSISTDVLADDRRTPYYVLLFPVALREEWASDSQAGFILLFGGNPNSRDSKEAVPSVSLARELTKDFVLQNNRPAGQSSILPWIYNQVEEQCVPLVSSMEMASWYMKDYDDPLVSVSEVGFSPDFSTAAVFLEMFDPGGAFGLYLLLEWDEESSSYVVVIERGVYQACAGV